ncbi:MAG: competence/damage-inducible protein A [Akkermansiaceae bacterium]
MQIEIINTGSELLLGNVQNTHGAWLGRELFRLGLRVARQITIPDGLVIEQTLAESIRRSDVVIVTGGLGPTSDDITREATAAVLGCDLIEDEAAMRSLEAFFATRKKVMAPTNRKQAQIPVGADVLPNGNGTAPGIYVPPRLNPVRPCAIFLLPGPPRELYPMFFAEVEPRLRALAGVSADRGMLEMKFTGVGESDFHQAIDDRLAAVDGLEYGYCARISEVDLRLIGHRDVLEQGRMIAMQAFAPQLISEGGKSLEEVVLDILREKNLTLATAESCTGGLIASRLTDVPGSSEVFTQGWVTYSNCAKVDQLGVSEESLTRWGAVSEVVAVEMAEGALARSGSDVAVAITGIAGPGGGTAEKPVGTAWLALARKNHTTVAEKVFHLRDRNGFKKAASQSALDLIRRNISQPPEVF